MKNNHINFQDDLDHALNILRKGGVILYPTDTIWGLGCDATNDHAIDRIYQIKKRSDTKSLISLVSDESMLNKCVKNVPNVAWDIIQYSEKPITIIYDDIFCISGKAIASDGSAGIRIVKDDFCKALIQKLGKPIISTSANFSEQPSPASFKDIDPVLLSSVDYVVKYRQQESAIQRASSIIKIKNNGEIAVIRK